MSDYSLKLAKSAFTFICRGKRERFIEALGNPTETQENLRRSILAAHEKTAYGKALGIGRTMSASEFQSKVPICDFDDGRLPSWIKRQKENPKESILAPGGVQIFEKTSGSSGNQKLIPYNRELLKSFENYFRIWASDLLLGKPDLKTLRIFMSISPHFRTKEEIEAQVGMEDDSEYLSPLMRVLFNRFLSVPTRIKNISEPEVFRDMLCAHLCSDRKLEIISIWHPSFLEILWKHLLERRKQIAQIMDSNAMLARSSQASKLLRSGLPVFPQDLWPELKLISAWDSGNSRAPALRLKELFPGVPFQGKGLLATEAPMTLPLLGRGSVPFLTDVLFEFIDEAGRIRWLGELKVGETYTLIISQKAGLLRYRIGDQVCVTGTTTGETPLLEFTGRAGECSDLVGEKLTGEFIKNVERDFYSQFGKIPFLLFPETPEAGTPGYRLLFDSRSLDINLVAKWCEDRLASAFHYRYARQLNQLKPVCAQAVTDLIPGMYRYYGSVRGMRTGDIKIKTFISKLDEARGLGTFFQCEAIQ